MPMPESSSLIPTDQLFYDLDRVQTQAQVLYSTRRRKMPPPPAIDAPVQTLARS
jgi:hypothetical protein